MRELGQLCHDVELTHDRLRHQVDLTTPATPKLNYQMAQTWEHHQLRQQKHQVQQRAHQLERREAAVLQLVPPMVGRLRRLRLRPPRTARRIVPVAVILHAGPGQQRQQGCEHRHDHIYDKPHLALLTRRREHRPRPTGHASTSRHHYVRFAAIGTTSA